MIDIRGNLERVKERIYLALQRAGRPQEHVTIVAVTKTHGPEVVRAAIEAGIADIGENRVQEFLSKAPLVDLPCRWHLVGHLQTNKVKKVIGRFALVQSVDSLGLAELMDRESARSGITTDILLEVNTSGEKSKFGFLPQQAVEACSRIASLPNVRIRGLMTVGPLQGGSVSSSAAFSALRRVSEEISAAKIEGAAMEFLSMGMSDDFEIAIAEGSNMVRLGRVLFGERTS